MTTTSTKTQPRRLVWYLAAAVALILVIGAMNGRFSPSSEAGPPLELSLGETDTLASCIQFDVGFLAQAPMAFEGTVTSSDGDAITLAVDHWYRGGDAETVSLVAPQGMEALIGGIDFVEGDQYLITASDGNVNYCGFSGPSTSELRSYFDEAFAS